jgi:hypothetical protein
VPDFRDGKTFPRRGRDTLGGFLWLARVFDKARAAANKTHDGYIYPCPMDRGVMRQWGITPREFSAALDTHQSDDSILAWMQERVRPRSMQVANDWVLRHKYNLDWQDWEEGFRSTRPAGFSGGIGLGVIITVLLVVVVWVLRAAHVL